MIAPEVAGDEKERVTSSLETFTYVRISREKGRS